MAIRRDFKASKAVRLTLPLLVIAALGAGASYFNHQPSLVADAEPIPLVVTGEAAAAEPVAAQTSPIQTSPTPPTVTLTPSAETPDPDAAPESDCPLINGFTVTITSGAPTCAQVELVATPYTDAILSREPLGTSLLWSGGGWDCSRNFGESDSIWDSHGLICRSRDEAFVLVSE